MSKIKSKNGKESISDKPPPRRSRRPIPVIELEEVWVQLPEEEEEERIKRLARKILRAVENMRRNQQKETSATERIEDVIGPSKLEEILGI